jgi:hypothetical protein
METYSSRGFYDITLREEIHKIQYDDKSLIVLC